MNILSTLRLASKADYDRVTQALRELPAPLCTVDREKPNGETVIYTWRRETRAVAQATYSLGHAHLTEYRVAK